MKRIHNLKNFYDTELVPELARIEGERKGIVRQMYGLGIAMAIIFPVIAYYIVVNNRDEPLYMLFLIPVVVLIAIGFYMVYESIIKNTPFYKDYKKDIIYRLIKYINPTLRYDKKHYISNSEYFNSGFFTKEAVHIDGDDHVSGTIDEVNIEFSELKVAYKNSSDKAKHKSDVQFHGIFFVADCPKPFPADLIIEPASHAGSDSDVILPVKNEAFNQNFRVRLPSRDYMFQATEMMSNDFLNKINTLKNQLANDIHISFIYNKMYVAIVHDKDLFEPSVWTPINNFDSILIHFKDLYVPIGIIEHLAAHKEFDLERETADLNAMTTK